MDILDEILEDLYPDCKVDECEIKSQVKGYCNKHYMRWKRNGHTNLSPFKKNHLKCVECNKPTVAGRFCISCINRFRHSFRYHNDEKYREEWKKRMREFQKSPKGKKYRKAYRKVRIKREICKIIYNHAHDPDIRADPEALSTEFIEDLVGVHCNRLESEAL